MFRLGIIGTGRIAKRAVNELAQVQELEVVSVYNHCYDHGKEFAERIGVSAALDLEEMAEQVDAVYIASPHGTHYKYARQMLEAGKHVICEKPMAFREAQGCELFELARNRDLVLMEGIKTAYCPGFMKIEEVVKSGVIGDVVDVEAAFTRLTPLGCREFDDRKNGGAFTEFGTYTMLPVFRFLGSDYSGVTFIQIPAVTGVDGYTKAVFSYGDGRSVSAMAVCKTGLTGKSEGLLLVSGTLGYVLVPSPWWLTRHFEVHFEDPSRIERYDCEFEGDGLRYEFREFTRRMREKAEGGVHDMERRELFCLEENEAEARAKVYAAFLASRIGR